MMDRKQTIKLEPTKPSSWCGLFLDLNPDIAISSATSWEQVLDARRRAIKANRRYQLLSEEKCCLLQETANRRGVDQGKVLEIAVEGLDNELGVLRMLAVGWKRDAEEEGMNTGEAERVVKKDVEMGEQKDHGKSDEQVNKGEEKE